MPLTGIQIVLLADLLLLTYSCLPYSGQWNRKNDREKSPLSDGVSSENLRTHLRQLTREPHVAGTEEELDTARYVRDKFLEYHLDSVKVVPYDVLLSYPDREKPNKVYVLDEAGDIVFSTLGHQKPLYAPEESSHRVFPTFNAYSAPGQPIGDLVYVGYGRREDFEFLVAEGISVKGSIVLARYGKSFRANIVKFAMEYGAIGVIFYSDPMEYASQGEGLVYPNGKYLPDMGVQSGTVKWTDGDPTTPHRPSVPGTYRIPESEAELPRIPAQPIGYREAKKLLENLAGAEAPSRWQGALNVTYRLGPGFVRPGIGGTGSLRDFGEPPRCMDLRGRGSVERHGIAARSRTAVRRGRGSLEPDRYVILGNHRDAWIFGAVDPSSGTASLLEAARLYGEAAKAGNPPRRTLLFCSWGAEEYGLIGSTEWVEEYANALADRTVINLNVDISVSGNKTLRAIGSPLSFQSLYSTTKKVGNPNPEEVKDGRPTVFDTWLHNSPSENTDFPTVETLGCTSDYAPFVHFLGIPSIDITYNGEIEDYPLYHSLYETFHLVDYLLDQSFNYTKAVTQVWMELADHYANSALLPFDVRDYSKFLRQQSQGFWKTFGNLLEKHNVSLDSWSSAIDNLTSAAEFFHGEHRESLDLDEPYQVRRFNDELMAVERVFINTMLPSGNRHMIYRPSSSNSYAGQVFGNLVDLMVASDPDWNEVKVGVSIIAQMIQSAANTLMGSINVRGF
ncbi:unnamed protein product [Darwinula stevensoni]|uniref:Uncharacterized protein n=1 Tax=Darwinula stevensoni TaxID=69355 RepID=A0A7R8XAA2_9CRUS|nr:unnamed protein product [Darwinula stevensoni]CAG0891741.1 unnamed protein product [Darwinula stevensoni]